MVDNKTIREMINLKIMEEDSLIKEVSLDNILNKDNKLEVREIKKALNLIKKLLLELMETNRNNSLIIPMVDNKTIREMINLKIMEEDSPTKEVSLDNKLNKDKKLEVGGINSDNKDKEETHSRIEVKTHRIDLETLHQQTAMVPQDRDNKLNKNNSLLIREISSNNKDKEIYSKIEAIIHRME